MHRKERLDDMDRTGKCMCGAVTYTAKGLKAELSACHCGMCRRWTGGPLLSATSKDVAWEGEDKIQTFKSSDWAERAFCSVCGSALFYRVTADGPHHGMVAVAENLDAALGLAEEVEGLSREYCRVLQLGGPKLLTDAEMAEVLERFKTYGAQVPRRG